MRKILIIFFVIFLTWWAVEPLTHRGYFPMHDDQQIARLYELNQSLQGGQFPPRWVSNLGFGYGYPLFNFYPPLVYYIGEIFHLAGAGYIDATKMVMGLGFILSALTMFYWVKSILDEKVAIVASVLYTYAPYHSVDLYVRGALAEFFSFIFFPLILLTIKSLFDYKSIKNTILFSLAMSGLILTHSLMVVPFGIFLSIYIVFLLTHQGKKEVKTNLKYILLGGIITFGLTAYFSLPSIFEKGYTLVDTILTRELANYKLHFVYLRQFWDSPWGYGGSIMGIYDGLTFQIGKIHIILSILAGLFGFIAAIKKRKYVNEILLFFVLMVFSVYLMSFHSSWLWEIVKPLWYIQFPWRFLSITAVFSSILGAYGIFMIINKFTNKLIQYGIVIITVFLIINFNQGIFHPERYSYFSNEDLTSKEDISWRVSKTSFEFVPKGVETTLSDINTTQLAIEKKDIPINSFRIENGSMKVKEMENLSQTKTYKIQAETPGKIVINTFNFPGWEAYIDGQKTTIFDKNRLKLITIQIPKGNHTLIVQFSNTPIRLFGNYITVLTIFSLIVVILLKRKRNNNAK